MSVIPLSSKKGVRQRSLSARMASLVSLSGRRIGSCHRLHVLRKPLCSIYHFHFALSIHRGTHNMRATTNRLTARVHS